MITILLVEDREEIRASWRIMLEPLNATILETESMAEARDLMRRIPPPDFVFLDLNLTDTREKETLAAIEDLRKANPRCVVMVLTGIPSLTLESVSRLMGADNFAHKLDVARQADLWRAMKRAIEMPNPKREAPPFENSIELLKRIELLSFV